MLPPTNLKQSILHWRKKDQLMRQSHLFHICLKTHTHTHLFLVKKGTKCKPHTHTHTYTYHRAVGESISNITEAIKNYWKKKIMGNSFQAPHYGSRPKKRKYDKHGLYMELVFNSDIWKTFYTEKQNLQCSQKHPSDAKRRHLYVQHVH